MQALKSPTSAPVIDDARRGLTPYSTDFLFLPEPNKTECAISAHLYATGISHDIQGVNLEDWVAQPANPVYCTYKRLNKYLRELGGVASCFVWCRSASMCPLLHCRTLLTSTA